MKLTDEQLKQYYASQGITRDDLLSAAPITLAELPSDVELCEADERHLASILAMWNGLDDLSKVEAAHYSERRVLKQRAAIRSEAWAAVLLLGRIRGCEQRREVMQKIARGELSPADARPRKRARKVVPAPKDAPSDGATASARAKGARGVDFEVTKMTVAGGETITVHRLRASRG
jgi:hypothetical protein